MNRHPVYETPAHLYPSALVADGEGGDAEFVMPEDVTALSADELAALETAAVEAFDAVRNGDDLTSADADVAAAALVALDALAQHVEAIRGEGTRREEAAGQATAAAEALAQRVHGEPAAAEGEGEEGAPAEGEGEEGEGEGEGGTGDGAEGEGAEGEPVGAGVTAGGTPAPRRVRLGRVRDRAPDPQVNGARPLVTLTASSDVPGYGTGATIEDTTALASALHGRARSMGNGSSAVVATIGLPDRSGMEWIGEDASKEQQRDAIEAARTEPAEGLIAAGGWCSPSQRTYEFFGVESATGGMLDLPTIGIERGGLEFPISPSIADVLSAPWVWTETDDIAALGNPHEDPDDDRAKPCFRIPCADWDEERLRANGICITHGNLSDRAWPEQTRRFVDLVMAAHAHKINERRIARVVAESTAVTIASTAGALAPLLSAVELQAEDYRDKFRMDVNATLETVFPSWIRGVVRADYARRAGVEFTDVTNAQLDEWWATRGVRPQYVRDWQTLSNTGGSGDGFRETWPTSALFLMYAAGTHVLGTGGEIDLGVVRDSRLNETNDHTAAWTEEFDLVAKVGHESRVVTVPVCANGVTSAAATAPTCPLA